MDIDRIYNIIDEQDDCVLEIPSSYSRSFDYESIYQLVVTAFYETKCQALTEERHLYDIHRYLVTSNRITQTDEYTLYKKYGTKLTETDINRHSFSFKTYHRIVRDKLFTYMKQFFGYRSKYTLLICHNVVDVVLTLRIMEDSGTIDKIVNTILYNFK